MAARLLPSCQHVFLHSPLCWSKSPAIHIVRCMKGKAGRIRRKKNHYEVLGIKHKASHGEIRAAFVQISKQIHPDKNPDDPDNHHKFVELNEAYNVLRRPGSRREYDVSLAHLLHYEQTLMRQGYSSHTPGDSSRPGSGTATGQSFESEQQAFWDETIWYMRDKSRDKDAFYEEDQYYGIKGIKRVPNSYIVYGCLGFMLVGSGIFYGAFKYSAKKSKLYIDEMNRRNVEVYNRSKIDASKYTTAEQLQKMFATHHNEIEKQAELVKNSKIISPSLDNPK